jgi:hypothetical protein
LLVPSDKNRHVAELTVQIARQRAIVKDALDTGLSIWETLSHTTGRLNRTERTMRKTRNALLGILTMMSGAILAVPTEAAERYIPSVHHYKAVPQRLFSYPYGGTHLRVDYAKRRFGYPYVGSYYGSYYAPRYYYDYRSPYYW